MHPTCLGEGSGVIWTSYRGMLIYPLPMHPTCLGEGSSVIWTSYRGMLVVMLLLSVSLVCLSVCVLCCWYVCMLLLSITICTFRSVIIAIVLIPVMVGWGDRVDGLLLWRPLLKDMWKL